MDVFARERVEVARQRGDERLALARAHLGDLAVVEGHRADQLHVEVAQAQRAHARLAHRGEGLGQHRLELLALRDALLVRGRERAQRVVVELFHGRLERVYLIDQGLVAFQLPALADREELR